MWLVEFRYLFGKNCNWGLCTAKIYIKYLVVIAFRKCFLLGNASK